LQVLSGGGALADRQADDARENALAVLLGSYRRANADAGDIYVEALARVLRNYPLEVVFEVCNPAGEFRRSMRFPPDAAELGDACDIAHGRIVRRAEREESIRKQREEREQRERDLAAKRDVSKALGELAAAGLVKDKGERRLVGSADVDWSTPLGPLPWCGRDDGKHAQRIAADVEARKARNVLLQEDVEARKRLIEELEQRQ
jgi:hypothetical protein